ncbi:MAG TPA: acylphosphatase [Gammaproteobacteria bacterium]|nr:acylphosphatase [Gammaproteobacteria bacterium]
MCRRCLVSGRVQGVFFRASTQARAQELGVSGYARNLPDGRVEVLACGAETQVAALCDWLWRGPTYAKVEQVRCEPVDVAPPDTFTTT